MNSRAGEISPAILAKGSWAAAAPMAAGSCATTVTGGMALSAGVVDVHERQVLRLLLGDVELDAVHDPGDGPDRDGHFPAAKHMPLLQQHVADVMAARVDDKPLNSPDLAVGGIDALIAPHADLTRGQGAMGAGRLIFSGLRHALASYRAVVRQHEHLFGAVARELVQAGPRREIGILGEAEPIELRPGAAQPDLLRCRGIDKAERDEATQARPVPRLDH